MSLIELDLSHNRLSSIEHLKVLTNLRRLSLQYNRIHSIPRRVLQKLENLENFNIYNIILYLSLIARRKIYS